MLTRIRTVRVGRSRERVVAVNVLDSLLVPEQDKDDGARRPGHEAQTSDITKENMTAWSKTTDLIEMGEL